VARLGWVVNFLCDYKNKTEPKPDRAKMIYGYLEKKSIIEKYKNSDK
jgi:hypothetical protein